MEEEEEEEEEEVLTTKLMDCFKICRLEKRVKM